MAMHINYHLLSPFGEKPKNKCLFGVEITDGSYIFQKSSYRD